jgi:exodeoxyribonuclease VII large subunit
VHATARALDEHRWRLSRLAQRTRARLPQLEPLVARQLELALRLRRATHGALERAAERGARIAATLAHLDPMSVLDRGYSIVQRTDGGVVRDGTGLQVGEAIQIRFAKGGVRARVDEKNSS